MKKLLAFVLILISARLFAQSNSCCNLSVNAQNNMLAMNEDFAKTHLNPLPFKLQNARGIMVEFKTPDGKTGHAYLVKNDKPTSKVIFVYHEWWGLNDYIKQEADKLQAEIGDVDVYAIDLYDGMVATTREDAQKYMGQMNEDRSKAIIQGAITLVGTKARITSIGWCMGGGWSMQSALLEGKQAAGCVMYYGMPESNITKLKTLNCDILGIFGTQDKFINPEVVKTFQANMQKAGKKVTVHNYNADHAFANPSNPKFNKEFTEDAHAKTIAYIKQKFA
jgi:carboxymethylenebutenolidase